MLPKIPGFQRRSCEISAALVRLLLVTGMEPRGVSVEECSGRVTWVISHLASHLASHPVYSALNPITPAARC